MTTHDLTNDQFAARMAQRRGTTLAEPEESEELAAMRKQLLLLHQSVERDFPQGAGIILGRELGISMPSNQFIKLGTRQIPYVLGDAQHGGAVDARDGWDLGHSVAWVPWDQWNAAQAFAAGLQEPPGGYSLRRARTLRSRIMPVLYFDPIRYLQMWRDVRRHGIAAISDPSLDYPSVIAGLKGLEPPSLVHITLPQGTLSGSFTSTKRLTFDASKDAGTHFTLLYDVPGLPSGRYPIEIG